MYLQKKACQIKFLWPALFFSDFKVFENEYLEKAVYTQIISGKAEKVHVTKSNII